MENKGDLYKLGLSVRAENCLRRARIESIRELQRRTDDQLMSIRGMGVIILAEIRGKLQAYLREKEWTEEPDEEPAPPVVHNTEDYQMGANAMRLAILRELDEMTRHAKGVQWSLLRDVAQMVSTREVP